MSMLTGQTDEYSNDEYPQGEKRSISEELRTHRPVKQPKLQIHVGSRPQPVPGEPNSTLTNRSTPVLSPLISSPQHTPGGLIQWKWSLSEPQQWSVQASVIPEETDTRVLRSDPALKKMLSNVIGNRVPKYLFRMWHPNSAGGIHHHSTTAIIPHGYKNGQGHKNILEMPLPLFCGMVDEHVHDDSQVDSEFTSWSPSPHFCLSYCTSRADTGYIAVIDTEKVTKTNAVLWVARIKDGKFAEEYLIHGPIGDKRSAKEKAAKPFDMPYVAVPFRELVARGLLKVLPVYGQTVQAFDDPGPLPSQVIEKITLDEVRAMRHVAAPFGKPFAVIVTIALLCIKRRSSTYLQDITEQDIDTVLRGLGKSTFNWLDWGASKGVLHEVYDPRFQDNVQMINLMRGLYQRTWGKRARLQRKKWAELGGDAMTPTTPARW